MGRNACEGRLKCPHCGAENVRSPLITLCGSCLQPLEPPTPPRELAAELAAGGRRPQCPECGAQNTHGAVVCRACGKALLRHLWYYAHEGRPAGPVQWDELCQWAVSGQISPAGVVCRVGDTSWVPAHMVAGLFAPTAGHTWEEVDAELSHRRRNMTTGARREAATATYRGAWVSMRGVVTEVTKRGQVRLRCNPRTRTHDTVVALEPRYREDWLRWEKGTMVCVVARFQRHSIAGHVYVHGHVAHYGLPRRR